MLTMPEKINYSINIKKSKRESTLHADISCIISLVVTEYS